MKILWTRRAIRHLTALREFISRDSASYAESASARILHSVELLAVFHGRQKWPSKLR
jgi:plasmid stabilization system protein ParE